MAVLDVISLPLIDPALQVEDESTSAGRLWTSVLSSVLHGAYAVSVAWGRDRRDHGTVVLFICWEDKQIRDTFHTNGLGITALNCYLSQTMGIQYIIDVPNEDVVGLQDSVVTTWAQGQAEGPHPHSKMISGEVHRLEMASDGLRINDNLEPAFRIAYQFKDDKTSGISPEDDRFILDVTLKPIAVSPSQQESPFLPRPTKLSEAFTRNEGLFGQSIESTNDEDLDIEGPQLSWRSPEQTSLNTDLCFSNRLAAPQPTERFSHLYASRSKKEHLEALYMIFKGDAESLLDETSEPSQSIRAYRKLLLYEKKCSKSWIITYQSAPIRLCIMTAWISVTDADAFHSSKDAQDTQQTLSQYLIDNQLPKRTQTIPFHPTHHGGRAEVVDFTMSGSALPAERRALEYYVWSLNALMVNNSSLGGDSVVYPAHDGWVEDDAESGKEEVSRQMQQQSTYRVVYYWKGEQEETQWLKMFVESPYALAGCRTHWAALASESVHGEHIFIQRDHLSLVEEPREDEEEEDLGF